MRKSGVGIDSNPKADQKVQKQLESTEASGAAITILLEKDASAYGGIGLKLLALSAKKPDVVEVIDRAPLLEEVRNLLS
jgi:histidyl-tRNA synthetase